MKHSLPIHGVISGENKGPTAWGLSVHQTMLFGVSIVVGFVTFILLTKLGMTSPIAFLMASLPPITVFMFFLKLVIGKPVSYARNWWAWLIHKLRRKPLFELELTKDYYEQSK